MLRIENSQVGRKIMCASVCLDWSGSRGALANEEFGKWDDKLC